MVARRPTGRRLRGAAIMKPTDSARSDFTATAARSSNLPSLVGETTLLSAGRVGHAASPDADVLIGEGPVGDWCGAFGRRHQAVTPAATSDGHGRKVGLVVQRTQTPRQPLNN